MIRLSIIAAPDEAGTYPAGRIQGVLATLRARRAQIIARIENRRVDFAGDFGGRERAKSPCP